MKIIFNYFGEYTKNFPSRDQFIESAKNSARRTYVAVCHVGLRIFEKTTECATEASRRSLYVGVPLGVIVGGIAGGVVCIPAPSIYALITSVFIGAVAGTVAAMILFGGATAIGGGLVGFGWGLIKGCCEVARGHYK